MLQQFGILLAQGCHVAGLLMIVAGGLQIGIALLSNQPPFYCARGLVLIAFGTWFSGVADSLLP